MKIYFNKALKILLAVNAATLFAGAMIAPIYAMYVEKIGGDLLDASLTSAIFSLVAGAVSLIAGRYSDKTKNNELIVALGYFVLGVGYFFYTLVDSILSLFAVQVFIGIGFAISSPPYDALYSKHVDGHKSGTQWAGWESMAFITTAVGAVAGGLIATEFGFQSVFVIMSVLSLGSALYVYLLPRKAL